MDHMKEDCTGPQVQQTPVHEGEDNQSPAPVTPKEWRIYDKQTRTWFDVTQKEYKEYHRWRCRIEKKEKYHGRCICPPDLWWVCDGMCHDCEYHCAGDMQSLEVLSEIEHSDEVSLLELFSSTDTSLSEQIQSKVLTHQIMQRLKEIMPEAFEIGSLRLLGMTDKAISEKLGINRTTFRSRIEKARKILRKEFGDFFDY